MGKYSELVRHLRRFCWEGSPWIETMGAAADAITKLEAEKGVLVECVKLLMGRCGPLASDGRQARRLLAKLEAGQ